MTRLVLTGAIAVIVGLAPVSAADGPSSVAEIQSKHDRSLIADLTAYLARSPRPDDADQAYMTLFNKAIEHDWFADTEEAALRYVKNDPDGPVKALAQIILTMARANAGRYDEALVRYKELMSGLGKPE